MPKCFCAGALAPCEILDVPPIGVCALWRAKMCRECENEAPFEPSSTSISSHLFCDFPFFGSATNQGLNHCVRLAKLI